MVTTMNREILAVPSALGFVTDFLVQYGIDVNALNTPSVRHNVLSQPIHEGERNNTLASIAGSLRHRDASVDLILSTLKVINQELCQPPLDNREVESIARSFSRYKSPKPDSRLPLGMNQQSSNEFRLKTLSELQNEPDDDIEWLVDELLPLGGISLDGAKPKVGKTTKNRNLARAVINGGTFLGRNVTATGRVLYYALEEKKGAFLNSFQRMGFVSNDLLVHFGMAPADPLAALEKDIEMHKPILVVIDPLLRFIRVQDLNDYAKVSLAMEPINELARSQNCHIMCVHHLGKADREDGDGVLGSTALFGSVDTLLITKKDPDGTRKISTIQRYGTDLPETVIELDKDTDLIRVAGTYAAIQYQKQEEEMEGLQKKIFGVLTKKPILEQSLRDKIGGNQRITSKALREMVNEGLIKRTGMGKKGHPYRYAIPNKKAKPVESKKDVKKLDSGLITADNQESSNEEIMVTNKSLANKTITKMTGKNGISYTIEDISHEFDPPSAMTSAIQAPTTSCPTCGSMKWWQLPKEDGGVWVCGECHPQK